MADHLWQSTTIPRDFDDAPCPAEGLVVAPTTKPMLLESARVGDRHSVFYFFHEIASVCIILVFIVECQKNKTETTTAHSSVVFRIGRNISKSLFCLEERQLRKRYDIYRISSGFAFTEIIYSLTFSTKTFCQRSFISFIHQKAIQTHHRERRYNSLPL